MKISHKQQLRIIKLLENHVEPHERQQLLDDVLLDTSLRHTISTSGDEDTFAKRLVRELVNLEQPSADEHPIFLLLDVLRDHYVRGEGIRTVQDIKASIKKENSRAPSIRWDFIFGVLGVVLALLTFLFGDNILDRFNTPTTPDPDDEVVIQVTDTPTERPVIPTNEPELFPGEMTLTAISQQAQGNATQTPTQRPTNTSEPPTQRPTNTSEPPTQRPTNTPQPTHTPRPRPTNTLPATSNETSGTITTSDTVTSNEQWAIEARTFDDGVEMVFVPAGCFQMGGVDSQAQGNEQPISSVCFNDGFWIDRYEVSNAQFNRLGGEAINTSMPNGDDYPRNNITWYEATAYCERVRSGRLPTEAEWEYAARGPDSLIYPWGDEFIEDNVVFTRNSLNQPAVIGSTGSASWVGAYDMAGNVSEWTQTIYGIEIGSNDFDFTDANEILYPYPYNAEDGRNAPPNIPSNGQLYVITRGGSYSLTAAETRASARSFFLSPQQGNTLNGFRCVRELQ